MEAQDGLTEQIEMDGSDLPSNVMEYVAGVGNLPAGKFYSKVPISTQRVTASIFAAPFFALSSLAPELLDKPTATVVLGGDVRHLTEEGGRWLTLFARLFQPKCKLAFSICSPGKPAALSRIKALFIQPPQRILKRHWSEFLAETTESPDAVLIYGPRSYNDIWNAVMSGALDGAIQRCTLLWAGPSEADMLIVCAMLRARHFDVEDPVPFCDSLVEQQPMRDGSWWIRIHSGSAENRGLSREEGISFHHCFSEFRGYVEAARDQEAARQVVAFFGTTAAVMVDGQPIQAVLVEPTFGIECTTGRIFQGHDEQTLSWQANKVSKEILNFFPEDDPARTPGENRYRKMAWLSRALDEGLDAAGVVSSPDSELPAADKGEDAQEVANSVAPAVIESEARVLSLTRSSTYRNRARLSRSAGITNVLALTARLGRPGSESSRNFLQARQEIASWLNGKGFVIDLARTSFTTENPNGEVSVESSDDSLWSMRFDDRSQMADGAFWRVETTLLGGETAAIGLRVVQVRQSDSAPPPMPGVPKVIATIANKVGLYEAGAPLKSSAWHPRNAADINQLFALLDNQDRLQPVIVISTTGDHSADKSSDRLAARLAGVAHVVSIDQATSVAFIDHFGRSLATYGNAVRLYRPGFNREADPFQHPLWTFGELPLPKRIVDELAEEACVIGVQREDLDERVPSFQEVRNVIANARMRTAVQQTQELASSAEEERDRQQTVRREIEALLQIYKADNRELLETNRKLRNDWETMLGERDAALDEVRRLKYQLKAEWSPGNVAPSPAEEDENAPYPETWDDLDAWVECYGNDRLVLLPQAVKAARKSPFLDIPFAYRVLEFLVEHYVPLRTRNQDDEATRVRYEEALAELGAEISPVGTATEQKLYKQEYRRKYNGKEVTLDLHVKRGVGFDAGTIFRLYFYFDPVESRVVVGHLPTHLTNRITHSG